MRKSLLIAFITTFIQATLAKVLPTEPSQKSEWAAGSEQIIKWKLDDAKNQWSKFDIELMSGPDQYMVFVGKVAENVDPSKKELSWTLPEVISPKSTIYFLQFYDSNNVTEKTWSTRFTITDENGEYEPPFHEKQPKTNDNARNKDTPWGIGKLTDGRVDQSQLPLHHNYPASDEADTKLKDGGKKNDELQETSDSNELIKFNVYMLITLVLVVVISS